MSPTVWNPSRLVLLELVVLLVVVGEHRRAAHEQLTGGVGPGAGDDVAVVVVQPDLDHRRLLAARARLAQLVLGPQDRVHAELGRAVHLEQRLGREVGDVLLLEGEAPRRGVGDHDPHRRRVVLGLHLGGQVADHADRRRRRERRRRLVRVEQAQPVLGVELALQHDGLAHHHRRGP